MTRDSVAASWLAGFDVLALLGPFVGASFHSSAVVVVVVEDVVAEAMRPEDMLAVQVSLVPLLVAE